MKHDDRKVGTIASYLPAAAGWVLFGLLGYIAAIAGIFYRPLIAVLAVAILSTSLFFLIRWLTRETAVAGIVFVLSVVLSVTALYGTQPFLYSGRDQGSIAEASVELARTGGLRFSSDVGQTFFDIYGPGKALNFPGFHYTDDGCLLTQFPIGTVSSFAAFVSLLGIGGLTVANALSLTFSMLTLFLLVRTLADERYALFAFLAASVSFLPIWSSRLAFSENVFLPTFLILSLALVSFLKEKDPISFPVALLSGAFLSLVRIEGLFAFAATLGILILSKRGRELAERGRTTFRVLPILFGIVMTLVNLLSNVPLYRSILKALLEDHFLEKAAGSGGTALSESLHTVLPLWRIFSVYGLAIPFALGLAGLLFLLFRRNLIALVPAMLALPTFLFLADPNITPDHPWMLRRFLFSLWPVFFAAFPVALYGMLGRTGRIGKFAAPAVFVVIVALSIPPTAHLFSRSEYVGLDEGTRRLTETVTDDDLLLIDRDATGDPYAIPAGPLRVLYGKNAAYFFNPADYERIRKDRYGSVYLLTPPENLGHWLPIGAMMSPVGTVPFSYGRFERPPLEEPRFPDRETVDVESLLFRLDPL